MKSKSGIIFLLCSLVFSASSAFAEVPEFLKKWEESPKEAAYLIPKKEGASFPLKFSSEEISSRGFVENKGQDRLNLCESSGYGNCTEKMSSYALHTDAFALTRFVGQALETNIYKLEDYKTGAADVTPWSGSYWPFHKGGIGFRYQDRKFPDSGIFTDNFKYYQKHYHKNSRKIADLNQLSPAEKYDLLFDDKDWSLTYYSWAVPRRKYQLSGEVETWTGICHGWAAAAIMVPEPKKSFEVTLPHLNKKMQVYPHDVKALASQLWAYARLNSFFLGGRCDAKSPATDENGRIIDDSCFDTNPATWHLALMNRMGKSKKSFVFDATYDYQVWNQPIASYQVRYFSPINREIKQDLNEAMVLYSTLGADPYAKYRSSKTKYLVGVELALSYVVENQPVAEIGVSQAEPRIVKVKYYYDLEIDDSNNVIGGEWYQLAHPDMFWRPGVVRPVADGELATSAWNGYFPLSNELFNQSKKASNLNQPLSAILDQFLQWASFE